MKTKLLALAFLAAGSMFAETHFSIGVNLGGYNRGYYAPPSYVAVRPPCPGPDYAWTDGYWAQDYGRRSWHNGFWSRQAYRGYQGRPAYDNRGYGNRGYDQGYYDQRQYQNRSFHRDRDDDDDRGRDYQRGNRQENSYGYGNEYRQR